MVSAMMAITATVSPNCQETRIENATRTRTATTTRSRQTRSLGLADRWARLPRCWPMPGGCALGLLDRGDHELPLGPGRVGRLSRRLVLRHGFSGRGPVPQRQVGRLRLRHPDLGAFDLSPRYLILDRPGAVDSPKALDIPEALDWFGVLDIPKALDRFGSSIGPGRRGAVGASGTGSAGPRAEPPDAPCDAPPCDRAPSCAAPLRLLPVISGPDDLFLSFGHAIRYHPPPQRNCLRTLRKAPSLRRLCPTPAGFIAGHSLR